eukprot:2909929-Rhodomonas_salina.1
MTSFPPGTKFCVSTGHSVASAYDTRCQYLQSRRTDTTCEYRASRIERRQRVPYVMSVPGIT